MRGLIVGSSGRILPVSRYRCTQSILSTSLRFVGFQNLVFIKSRSDSASDLSSSISSLLPSIQMAHASFTEPNSYLLCRLLIRTPPRGKHSIVWIASLLTWTPACTSYSISCCRRIDSFSALRFRISSIFKPQLNRHSGIVENALYGARLASTSCPTKRLQLHSCFEQQTSSDRADHHLHWQHLSLWCQYLYQRG